MRPISGPGSQTSESGYTEVGSFKELGRVITNIIGVRQVNLIGAMWFDLVEATPVCTGYARGSWFVTTGIVKSKNPLGRRADTDECKRLYDYPTYPEVLYKYSKPGARKVTTWYIVNLAPYMEILNTGTSKKKAANYQGWINDIVSKHVIGAKIGQIKEKRLILQNRI